MHPWLEFDPGEARGVVTEFIATYVERAGAEGIVLGVSGGLDSAVTAALAVEALGTDRVKGFALPGPGSRSKDASLAAEVAEGLGIELTTISIATAVEALAAELDAPLDQPTRANVQPRLRMTALYAHAQHSGRLVCGTGNKSELLVGYFTKYGDGGVDLLPIGDLYKTQVRRLAEDLDVPDEVRTRPPTAGLWDGQTDEGELGLSYEALDVVLAGLETDRDHERICEEADVDADEVARVEGMVRSTWHKRSTPPVPKLGFRTPGVDWREPLNYG